MNTGGQPCPPSRLRIWSGWGHENLMDLVYIRTKDALGIGDDNWKVKKP